MKHPVLKVEKREVFGKKLKRLRANGTLPGNVYGPDMKSTAVQVTYTDFLPVYKAAKNTGIVDLQLDGKTLPVLIHQVHRDHLRDLYLHADFFKVNLKEKIKTAVPVVITGDAPAVTNNVGFLQQVLSEVEVEALPTDLPENVQVDVTELEEVDEYIPVEELKAPQGVTILTDPNQAVVKVAALVSPEAEEEAAEEAAEAEAAGETEEAPTEETTETTKEGEAATE